MSASVEQALVFMLAGEAFIADLPVGLGRLACGAHWRTLTVEQFQTAFPYLSEIGLDDTLELVVGSANNHPDFAPIMGELVPSREDVTVIVRGLMETMFSAQLKDGKLSFDKVVAKGPEHNFPILDLASDNPEKRESALNVLEEQLKNPPLEVGDVSNEEADTITRMLEDLSESS